MAYFVTSYSLRLFLLVLVSFFLQREYSCNLIVLRGFIPVNVVAVNSNQLVLTLGATHKYSE